VVWRCLPLLLLVATIVKFQLAGMTSASESARQATRVRLPKWRSCLCHPWPPRPRPRPTPPISHAKRAAHLRRRLQRCRLQEQGWRAAHLVLVWHRQLLHWPPWLLLLLLLLLLLSWKGRAPTRTRLMAIHWLRLWFRVAVPAVRLLHALRRQLPLLLLSWLALLATPHHAVCNVGRLRATRDAANGAVRRALPHSIARGVVVHVAAPRAPVIPPGALGRRRALGLHVKRRPKLALLLRLRQRPLERRPAAFTIMPWLLAVLLVLRRRWQWPGSSARRVSVPAGSLGLRRRLLRVADPMHRHRHVVAAVWLLCTQHNLVKQVPLCEAASVMHVPL
jgi:hypothetical protein